MSQKDFKKEPEQKDEIKDEIIDQTSLNLFQKINLIANSNLNVEKNGNNDYAGYKYKTFTDIKRAVCELMAKLHVVFLPSASKITPELMSLKTGKEKDWTVTYIQEYQLINADKPEQRQTFYFPMIGTNTGGLDKANGSATTYGLKYLFNLWGLIPDESLDPDNSVETAKKANTGKAIDKEVERVWKLIHSNKESATKVAEIVGTTKLSKPLLSEFVSQNDDVFTDVK